MLNLASIRAVLLDMDGVIHRGSVALPGATDLAPTLDQLGIKFACLTNNSSQLPHEFSAKFAANNIQIRPEQIITSSTATAKILRDRYPRGTRLFAIGMNGVQSSLFGDGYFVSAEHDVTAVVVGVDFELTYARLRTATLALRAGATFIATNGDKTFPTPEGLIPGAGAIVAAVQAASDCVPEVIGKPEPAMFAAALAMLGVTAAQTLMIGDRLDTDILGAQRAGIATAFVGTGVNSMSEAHAWQPRIDIIAPNLAAVLDIVRNSR